MHAGTRQRALMRALLFFVLAAISMPAHAQDERRFVSETMGFEVRLPDGFATTYADPEMEVLESADGTREILLLGANSFDPLERLVERHMGYDQQDGWTTQLLSSTPSWAIV